MLIYHSFFIQASLLLGLELTVTSNPIKDASDGAQIQDQLSNMAVTCPSSLVRVDCGFSGVTQALCIAKGCCWGPLAVGVSGPWCFNGVVSVTSPTAIIIVSPTASSARIISSMTAVPVASSVAVVQPAVSSVLPPISSAVAASTSTVLAPVTSASVAVALPVCDYLSSANLRVDCGFSGVTQALCIAKGCCWGPLAVGVSGPWCFNGVVSVTSPTAIIIVSPTASSARIISSMTAVPVASSVAVVQPAVSSVLPPISSAVAASTSTVLAPVTSASVAVALPVCDYLSSANLRVDCGFSGVTQALCIAKGCCWGPLAVGVSGPWCFNGVVSVTSPTAIIIVSPTASSARIISSMTAVPVASSVAVVQPAVSSVLPPISSAVAASTTTVVTPTTNVMPSNSNSFYTKKESLCVNSTEIDVNLGDKWSDFITAAYCQIFGTFPPPSFEKNFEYQPDNPRTRRIDAIRAMCVTANRTCALTYSDPWANGQMQLSPTCVRKNTRDLGAIFMFFFFCPGNTNCNFDWANNHAYAFKTQEPVYNGYLNPSNYGFWLREFTDAVYAGLQFLLPNVYGPDIYTTPSVFSMMNQALESLNGAMKLGLMDDTWIWGTGYGGPMFAAPPDLYNVSNAAQVLYSSKWKPFFQGVQKQYWYTVQGRPFINFYNAGTLKSASQVTIVVEAMKRLFLADFGVAPFVVLDIAFPPGNAADAQFLWNTFYLSSNIYFSPQYNAINISVANFMPRWDSKGRDAPGQILQSTDRLAKGPEILIANLNITQSTNIVVMGTWNDLGEGTGINRCYDYYYKGQWLPPNYFMDITRAAQCV